MLQEKQSFYIYEFNLLHIVTQLKIGFFIPRQ